MFKKVLLLTLLVLATATGAEFAAAEVNCCGYSSPGNPYLCYTQGNCTWWAWYNRPDLPGFSDAGNWLQDAKNAGIVTGDDPIAGSIVCLPNHVAYVEEVYPNGSYLTSEMDYTHSWICVREKVRNPGEASGFIYGGSAGTGPTYIGDYVRQTPTDPSGILRLQPNELVNCSFTFRNEGTAYWTNDGNSTHYVELHSVNSSWNVDQASSMAVNWIGGSNVKIATTAGMVDPNGGLGLYSFQIRTPSIPGRYTLNVALYHPRKGNFISGTGPAITLDVIAPTADATSDIALIETAASKTWVARSTGSSFVSNGNLWGGNLPSRSRSAIKLFSANVDRTGVDEVIVMDRPAGAMWVLKSTGNGFENYLNYGTGMWEESYANRYQILVGDFNGDNYPDLLAREHAVGKHTVRLGNGSGWPTSVNWLTRFNGDVNRFQCFVADVNVDGKDDLLIRERSSGYWTYFRSTGSSFTEVGRVLTGWVTETEVGRYHITVAYLNNDNYPDLVAHHRENGNIYVMYGTSTGGFGNGNMIRGGVLPAGAASDVEVSTGDPNGDGADDLVFYQVRTGDWYVCLGSRNGSVAGPVRWITNFGKEAGGPSIYRAVVGAFSPWSSSKMGDPEVVTNTEVSTLPFELGLTVSPQPIRSSCTIAFRLPADGMANVRIYDASGRLVDDLGSQRGSENEATISWQPRNLPSGIYFVQLEAGAGTATRKITLVR